MREAVLVIGGLDSTGQSGLARDVAALAVQGWHAAPVATRITIQTSAHVSHIEAVAPDLISAQCAAACEEFHIQWLKVGALFSAGQVEAVAAFVLTRGLHLVLDPVLAASSGTPFLDGAGIEALRRHLLPLARLVTPNEAEAQALNANDLSSPLESARLLTRQGAAAALVKGSGRQADVLWDGQATTWFEPTPQPGPHRGTGCRLAAHATGLLAWGTPLHQAVRIAQAQLQSELAHASHEAQLDGPQQALLHELRQWWPRIMAEIRAQDVPEVGMNVAYALPGATDPRRHVAGLAGRITIAGFGRAVSGQLAIGGPHHTGRIATVLQEIAPALRVVLNHRYDDETIVRAQANGLRVASFERSREPSDASGTMEWGMRYAVANCTGLPDLVWDAGGPGKEAMIRVLARDPKDLVRKLQLLHGESPVSAPQANLPLITHL